MKTNVILNGDALKHLKEIPEESINCVMTSPPYWALRDYGIEGQLGLEQTFEEYINKLCDIFDQVKRVLRKDGTCWINIGDTYSTISGNMRGKNFNHPKYQSSESATHFKQPKTQLPDKSLIMIPFRFAIEMVNRGWILRNTIIWHKPNCMPSSVKDRFTVDFEYIFFFVKNKKYWFEKQYDPHLTKENRPDGIVRERTFGYDTEYPSIRGLKKGKVQIDSEQRHNKNINYSLQGRNKRTVWKIPTQPFPGAHFAVYPEAICETPIKSGCPVGGIVLDPFFGAGTTGVVALKQNKQFIGIELNPEYIEMAKKRLKPLLEQTKISSVV